LTTALTFEDNIPGDRDSLVTFARRMLGGNCSRGIYAYRPIYAHGDHDSHARNATDCERHIGGRAARAQL